MAGSPSRSRRSRSACRGSPGRSRGLLAAADAGGAVGVRLERKRPAPLAGGREAEPGKRSAITPLRSVGTRRARISETPRARAASARMFSASSSSWRPNTWQLITQLTSSSAPPPPSFPPSSPAGSSSMTLTMPLSPNLSSRRNCSVSACGSAARRRHLRLGAADRRGVELVGLVEELGDAGEVQRVHRAELDGHGELPEELLHVAGGGRQARARGSPRTARRASGPRRRPPPRSSRPRQGAHVVRGPSAGSSAPRPRAAPPRAPAPARPGCRRRRRANRGRCSAPWRSRRFAALSVQLATKAAKSARFKSISGWSNAASAMPGRS